MTQPHSWTPVCSLEDIAPDTGVCALVDGHQIAIFRHGQTDALYAIGNFDPIGKANVLSRGLLAQLDDRLTVASPLYKQHFCLQTGHCLEHEQMQVPVYPVQLCDGTVQVSATPTAPLHSAA